MSEEAAVVNVKSEEDGRLIVLTPEGKDKTYYLNPIRTMHLVVSKLELSQSGSKYFDDENEPWEPLGLSPILVGTAVLEDRSLSVIGEPGNKTNVLRIRFRPLDIEQQRQLQKLGQENGRKTYYRGVALGFSRHDWEIGNKDEWWVECGLSSETFSTIASAVTSGALRRLEVGLDMEDIYTDDNWAPPSCRVNWFIRPDRSNNSIKLPEMAHGEVRSLSVGLQEVELGNREDEEADSWVEEEPIPEPEEKPDIRAAALLALAGNVEKVHKSLGLLVWLVGFCLLFLIFK